MIEGGFYKVLLACIKVTTGKEFHMVQAAWNVKEDQKEDSTNCKPHAM